MAGGHSVTWPAAVVWTLGFEPALPTTGGALNLFTFLTTDGGSRWVGSMVVSQTTPVGTVIWYSASTAPSGYLKADGVAVSRATYADLFAVIGTTFGNGDGSTTFNLPDLRGEFIRGWDDGRSVDSGRLLGSAQTEEVGPHTHSYDRTEAAIDWNDDSFAAGNNDARYRARQTDDGGGSENRPRNIALLACIKY